MAVRYSDRKIQLTAQSKAEIRCLLAPATKKVGSHERTVDDYKGCFVDKASLDKLTASSPRGIVDILQGSVPKSFLSERYALPILPDA
eukprot:3658634-Karenia_brevis.AAC.1